MDIFDQLAQQSSPSQAAAPTTPGTSPQPQSQPQPQPQADIFDRLAANGGKLDQAPQQQPEENIDRPGYKPGYFETLYHHGVLTAKHLGQQFGRDVSDTFDRSPQVLAQRDEQFAAEDAKKNEVYHKIKGDLHDAISKRNVGGIINAIGDFSSLFQDPKNPNDVAGTIADAYITGTKNAYHQTGIHAERVATAVDDAALKYISGDRDGAIKSLSSLPKDTLDTLRNALTFAASVTPAGGARSMLARGFTSQIANQGVGEIEQGKTAEGLADMTVAAAPKVGEVAKDTNAIGRATDFVKNSSLSDAYSMAEDTLSKLGIQSPIRTMGENTPAFIKNGLKFAGKATGATVKTGVAAAKAAAPYAKEYFSGLADGLTDEAKDSVSTLTNAASAKGSEVMDAMKDIRDKATKTLADQGITGDKAVSAVNDLMNRVQDKYAEWKNPSVSGGSSDAMPEPETLADAFAKNVKMGSQAAWDLSKQVIARANEHRLAMKAGLGGAVGAVGGAGYAATEAAATAGMVAKAGIGGGILGAGVGLSYALGRAAYQIGKESGYSDSAAAALREAAQNLAGQSSTAFTGFKSTVSSWLKDTHEKWTANEPGNTPVTRAAAIYPEIAKNATSAQLHGGGLETVSNVARDSGALGKVFRDKYDQPSLQTAKEVSGKLVDDITGQHLSVEDAGTAVQKSLNDIIRGANGKVLETLNQLSDTSNPKFATPAEASPQTTSSVTDILNKIQVMDPALKTRIINTLRPQGATLGALAGVRGMLQELGLERLDIPRIDIVQAMANLDQDIGRSLSTSGDEVGARSYQADATKAMQLTRASQQGLISKMLSVNPEAVGDALSKASDKDFKSLTEHLPEEQHGVLRQTLLGKLVENNTNRLSGTINYEALAQDVADSSKKLGPYATKAQTVIDGLAKIAKDAAKTKVGLSPAWKVMLGTDIAGHIWAVMTGQSLAGVATEVGAQVALTLGSKALIKYAMTTDGLENLKLVQRAIKNMVPGTSATVDKQVKKTFQDIGKSMKDMAKDKIKDMGK